MNKIIRFLCFALCFCILFSVKGSAAVFNAASCQRSDVQGAINSAGDGDVVLVPEGNCTWTSTVEIINKAITLKGEGIDSTNIHSSATDLIRVRGQENDSFRITGFTFSNTNGETNILIGGTDPNFSVAHNRNWRIDHVKIEDTTGSKYGIYVSGDAYGVIDNCIFSNVGQAIFVEQPYPSDNELFGDNAWTQPIDWGGPNAVYVEDCTFVGNNMSQTADGRYGGRFVLRHNNIKDVFLGVEPHSGCPNGHRAVMHTEIYENTITGNAWLGIRIRGGTSVIFNNDFGSSIKDPILVDNQRSCEELIGCLGAWANNGCDGTSSYDGNTPGEQGWPCIDQIGRGANQASDPMYEWGNESCSTPPCGGTGTDVNIEIFTLGELSCARQTEYHLKASRDFYNDTQKPGYTPYTYPHPLRTSRPDPPTNPRIIQQ